jgi:hypothetical protein
MRIVFIDYSETYYRDSAGTEIPERYKGKFVQIRKGSSEYLVFSPKEYTRFHADIVRSFCTEREIPGVFNSQSKTFDIHDPSWVVAGGGKFEIDRGKKLLRLYDNSMAYGRFDRRGLKEKILAIAKLSDYKVRIE